jgi:polyphosphate glucokinase
MTVQAGPEPGASPMDTGPRRLAIGVDIGGSGIKVAVVDVVTGTLATPRLRVVTPQPSTPRRCAEVTRALVDRLAEVVPLDPTVPLGLGVPGVTMGGVVLTAANIAPEWIRFDAARGFAELLGRPVTVVNDADAAGVAEMRFGAGRGRSGSVLVITLGTGIGSALFRNGELVPNMELGHMEVRGKEAEARASAAVRTRRHMSWAKWALAVDEVLRRIDALLWPDLIVIGGGVSKAGDKFIPRLTVRPPVVAAQLRNEAGIVGAAMLAAGER